MSGRIEETNRPTVIALVNSVSYCIRISARDKRTLLAALKKLRPERRAVQHQVLVFATLVFFLIKDYLGQLNQVTIDLEYPTYEASIKEHILNLCRRYKLPIKCEIVFHQVGKKSPAHELAIQVYRGKAKANKTITAKEILKELR